MELSTASGQAAGEEGGGLLERELELATIEALFDRARAGRGGRLLIEGPPGIGKSALLELALERAERSGIVCLRANGSEVGSQVAFGVARTALRSVWPDASPTAETVPSFATRAAQAVLELSESSPVVVCVDDVQWVDGATIRWLSLLAERSLHAHVAVALGVRTGAEGSAPPGLGELLNDRRAVIVRPAPLSDKAVGELLRGLLGETTRDELAQACQLETGGNPYLLGALVQGLRQSGIAPGNAEGRLREVGSRTIARDVAQQLARLEHNERLLLETVAMVGDLGGTLQLAPVAGVEPGLASDAAQALARLGLFRSAEPPEIAHPLVAAAIRSQLTAKRREQLALAAAEHLLRAGRVEEAAARLLDVAPRGDAQVAQTLIDAAARASAGGAPDVATTLLDRAVAEPPAPSRLADAWTALGTARLACGNPEAVTALTRALEYAASGPPQAIVARSLAQALMYTNQIDRAIAVLDEARAGLDQTGQALADELEVLAIYQASIDALRRPEYRRRLRDASRRQSDSELAQRMLLAELASESLLAAAPASETARLAERALAAGTLLSHSRPLHSKAVLVLAYAGRPGAARGYLQDAMAYAQARGDTPGLAVALVLHGEARRLEGDMVAVEADSRTGLDLLPHGELGPRFMLRGLLESLAEQGQSDAAGKLLRGAQLAGELPAVMPTPGLLYARARVRMASGSPEAALTDLRQAGKVSADLGLDDPVSVPWRLAAAEALAELGDRASAAALAHEHLSLARRTGLPAAIGAALRVSGVIAGGADGLEDLQEAVALLEHSYARLELARALADLGTATVSVDPPAARELLDRSAGLAAELGASILAERAQAALLDAGARPRRAARRGVQALTTAERRTARLAATGMTNREIAQTLVLSEKTIESHLASAFRKLGIRSRTELPIALTAAEPGKPRG